MMTSNEHKRVKAYARKQPSDAMAPTIKAMPASEAAKLRSEVAQLKAEMVRLKSMATSPSLQRGGASPLTKMRVPQASSTVTADDLARYQADMNPNVRAIMETNREMDRALALAGQRQGKYRRLVMSPAAALAMYNNLQHRLEALKVNMLSGSSMDDSISKMVKELQALGTGTASKVMAEPIGTMTEDVGTAFPSASTAVDASLMPDAKPALTTALDVLADAAMQAIDDPAVMQAYNEPTMVPHATNAYEDDEVQAEAATPLPATSAPPSREVKRAVESAPAPHVEDKPSPSVSKPTAEDKASDQVRNLIGKQYVKKFNVLTDHLRDHPDAVRVGYRGQAVVDGWEIAGSSYVDVMKALYDPKVKDLPPGTREVLDALNKAGVPPSLISSRTASSAYNAIKYPQGTTPRNVSDRWSADPAKRAKAPMSSAHRLRSSAKGAAKAGDVEQIGSGLNWSLVGHKRTHEPEVHQKTRIKLLRVY